MGLLMGSLTLLGPNSASAVGESLTVVLTQQDGTAPFNADSAAGHDAGDANGIVRTNDNLTYNVEIRVEDAASTNTTFTAALPRGVEMAQVPPYCTGPGSTLTPALLGAPVVPVTATSWTALPQQTLVCNVGDRTPNSTLTYPVVAKVRPEVPNGTVLQLDSVRATTTDVTTPAESGPVEATVSARAQFDLSKNAMASVENTGYMFNGGIGSCPVPGFPSRQCFTYQIGMLISGPAGGKGLTPMAPSLTFIDDLTPESFYPPGTTSHPAWLAAGPDALAKYGASAGSCGALASNQPGPAITGGYTEVNAVRSSGTVACTQPGGPGTPVTIQVTNMDSTAYTYPSMSGNAATGPVPVDKAYVFSYSVRVSVPVDAVMDLGVANPSGSFSLPWDNKYKDFAPVGIDGVANHPDANPLWNDHRGATSTVGASGAVNKAFAGVPGALGNTPSGTYAPGLASAWEGPAGNITYSSGQGLLFPGQTTISAILLENKSTSPVSRTFLVCDSWDPSVLRLTSKASPGGPDIPGSAPSGPVGQRAGSGGSPVWQSGYRDTAFRNPPFADLGNVIEYGTGPGGPGSASTCGDSASPAGWHTDPNAAVFGNDPALAAQGVFTGVSRVRIRTTLPYTSQGSVGYFSIGLQAAPEMPVGTIFPNWANFKQAVGDVSFEEMTDPGLAWMTNNYQPSNDTGGIGDRLRATEAIARIVKTVKDPGTGTYGTTTPLFTGGQLADFRIQPSLTSSIDADRHLPVVVEDCLPAGTSFQAATAVPSATVIEPSSPAGANLVCAAGETYVQWDLGLRLVNDPIPAITYSVRVANGASAGTKVNRALITADGDLSPVNRRQSQASIQLVQPAGIAVDKMALTPQVEVNRAGETNEDPLRWRIDFVNINSDPGPTDVDIIDQLPKQGTDGTDFTGTLAFDSATLVQGDEPGQDVEVLYTRQADVDTDPGNTTNHVATGSTVWCSLSGSTFTRVLGSGTSAACPATVADVTGLRIRRPGRFGPNDQISVEIQMTPSANRAGDVYVNEVAGRAEGLALLVGPALAPATVVASSIGDYVWNDTNLNGIQDDGEEPIAGFPVRLTGTDSDGNAVGPLDTTTGADGRYSFTGLQSGSYAVTFLPSGLGAGQHFTLQDAGANDLADSDGDPATGVASVTLTPNTVNLSIDQGVFTADPDIEVTKSINGDDANTAPGVLVEPGEDMEVTFEVHNTGNMVLDPVVLTDDTIDADDIACPKTVLAVDETMTCTAPYPAPAAGEQHTNLATVVGTPIELPDGTQLDDVTDDDPANAYGIVRRVDITKDLVGDPVPNGDGTSTVTYDVVVTNEGTQAAVYDLDDELHFGTGATVTGASVVSGPSGVTLNPGWDGAGTTRIATGVNIGIDGVQTYRVRATASIDTTTATTTSSDCDLTQGETGTGLLNGATLTFDGEETDVDACAEFPVTTFTKTLAGPPVANGDGTYTVGYDIVVTNDGAANDHYDLADQLRFGGSIEIDSATVANTAPGTITTSTDWDGIDEQAIVTGQTIGAGASHTYRVNVVASVDGAITLEESDCNVQQGEDGTGFLNGATLTVNGTDSDDDACAPAPNTSMTKVLFGDPIVEDDDTITSTYVVTVTNTGAGDDVYDLDDELQFGAGITVNTATVANTAPGSIVTNAGWDGTGDTEVVAGQAIAAGATHVYVVTVNSTIGTTTTASGADCTLTEGEDGTGLLNGAVLTVNGETAEDDACGTVDPVIEMDKTLVGAPVRNADGTWEVTYDIDVTNRIAPNAYDLTDELTFGAGIEVVDADVSNTDPGDITTAADWDGTDNLGIVSGEPIGAGVTHTYRVVVTAHVPTTATATTTDCTVGSGETGTGFFNGATVTTETQELEDDACAEAPNVTIVKDLVGEPVVNDDRTIGLRYEIKVTNAGAGADEYDLDDELRFGDDITVNDATVANTEPGDITTNPAWDGTGDTSVAIDVPIAGAGAEPVTHTYEVTVNATVGMETTITEADCTLDRGEAGTGFLNDAILTIDEHQVEDDACGSVNPEIVVEKTLVGAPTANGDGTWTIDYEIVATNVGPVPGAYDLDDELTYGQNVSVISAAVENSDPGDIDANPDWDGVNDIGVVRGQAIAVSGAHTYDVTVEASAAPSLTTVASDCELGSGETGTGFLNTATLTYEGSTSTDDACGEISSIHVVKKIKGTPAVFETGKVDVTYTLTVSNTGAAAGTYRIDDKIRWGNGLTVNGAEVTATPAGTTADPAWNGTDTTLIAEGVELDAGESHVWEVHVTGQRGDSMTTATGDCALGGGEDGTGLLNTATVTSNGQKADSSDCGPVKPPAKTIERRQDDPPTGSLPYTGSQLTGVALTGLALLAAGLFLRGASRGRRKAATR